MTIINTSPDRIIQLGYEGEDRVTVLRFRYGADWLENGEGVFHIRVRRHGEHTAYNAALVTEDPENNCLLMTVTNTELSVKGSGEMQVVYSGENFVKKSPIYSYNVSRAVDEVTDPPTQDVYTQIIESLSDLQTDVSGITEDIGQIENSIGALSALTTAKIGDLTELTTEAKSSLVSAINEVNSKSVDDALSATSTNPVQNKVITEHIDNLNSTIDDLGESIEDVQTAVQGKADIQTVTTLSGVVSSLQTSKADKTYVDVQLDGKASTQTVSDLVDDVYDIYPTDTASGVIANFPDGANSVPVKSLTVDVEPAQDLHGYDSPWPAGGGKNLLPSEKVLQGNNILLGTDTNLANDTICATLSAGTYTLSVKTSDNTTTNIYAAESGTSTAFAKATNANSLTFTVENTTNVRLWAYKNGYGTVGISAISEFQLEKGSTATDWTPYSNICPISGWTGAKVTRCGKNWIDDTKRTVITETTVYIGTAGVSYDTFLKAGTYTISCDFEDNYGMFYKKSTDTTNRTLWNSGTAIRQATFTIEEDGSFRFWVYRNVASGGVDASKIKTVQVELGSTATAYEPYSGETYDITFPSEAGTVYGGTLDVTTGVLTVDRANVDLGTLTWTYNNTRTRFESADLGSLAKPAPNNNTLFNGICSSYTAVAASSVQATNGTIGLTNIAGLLAHDDRYDNATAFKTAMSGVQLVYELATTITYTLTPQEVRTLLGQNNIWADAGDTTVEYRANTSAYIAKKIAEAISALS